jgi:hypothetical protein
MNFSHSLESCEAGVEVTTIQPGPSDEFEKHRFEAPVSRIAEERHDRIATRSGDPWLNSGHEMIVVFEENPEEISLRLVLFGGLRDDSSQDSRQIARGCTPPLRRLTGSLIELAWGAIVLHGCHQSRQNPYANAPA